MGRVDDMRVAVASAAGAARTLSVEELKALALRSPNVFDTFFEYQQVYRERQPVVFFEGGAVVGPAYTISVDGVDTEAHVAGGQVCLGGVPWKWRDEAGVRVGVDFYSTNLTPKGSPMEDGWGYRTVLAYGSIFDRSAGWSGSLGLFVRMRPVTRLVGGRRVFSSTETGSGSTDGAGVRYGNASGRKTTEMDSTQGFIHGTIPVAGLTTGFLFDRGGVSQLKGHMQVVRASIWESAGPEFAAIPQFRNYQVGVQATRVRAWAAPVSLSTEATGRYERGLGTGFDHALLKAELTLFGDGSRRDRVAGAGGAAGGFHLRIEVHGSCFNRPEFGDPWGWGVFVDAMAIPVGSAGMHIGMGGGRNYYEDIVTLPIANETTFRFAIGFEL